MFRWHWVLVSLPLLLLYAIPAVAHPIKVHFTVQADPEDPNLAGVTGTGYFIFDSSLIPFGGGLVSATFPPGLPLTSLSFTWDGELWTENNSFLRDLSFTPDGTLIGFYLQAKDTPVAIGDRFPDFGIYTLQSPSFNYAVRPPGSGGYAGAVTAWDAAALPIILAAAGGPSNEHFALDSFGRVFRYADPGLCPNPLGTFTVLGNMFDGPAPHRVVNLLPGGGGNAVMATLENGDIWRLCSPGPGTLIGNILYAPGIASVPEETPPLSINSLSQNRPNPFNPSTTMPYSLATGGRVIIKVFDVSGRLVRKLEDSVLPAGNYTARWDGRDEGGSAAASGTYFCRIEYPGGGTAERKVTIVR